MPARAYDLIPVRRWLPTVASAAELSGDREGVLVCRPAGEDLLDPPDFAADPEDVAGIGEGRSLGYHLENFRLGREAATFAALNEVRIDKLGEIPRAVNTYNVLVSPSLALAEQQHCEFTHRHLLRHIGETVEADVAGRRVPVQIYDDIEPDQVFEQPVLLLASRFTHFNYFHFVVDLLGRLWALSLFQRPEEIALLLPHSPLEPFQAEILQTLGLPNPMHAMTGRMTRVRRLYMPSFYAPGGYSREQMAFLSRMLRMAFGVEGVTGGRRLWLSRADASWRRVANEDEVMRALGPLGFEAVVPGRLPVAGQARLFAEAEIVVAPHGAGNTNMLFARPGATLIEIVPGALANNCYYMLTKLNGQRYGRVLDRGDKSRSDDVRVDVPRLMEVVGQVLRG
ncbi:MAG: glycosyltransferase family 61 protein [Caulobacter sp.]|nr:glycosyltransferase family 61 protein [Caulobacter sp.]